MNTQNANMMVATGGAIKSLNANSKEIWLIKINGKPITTRKRKSAFTSLRQARASLRQHFRYEIDDIMNEAGVIGELAPNTVNKRVVLPGGGYKIIQTKEFYFDSVEKNLFYRMMIDDMEKKGILVFERLF